MKSLYIFASLKWFLKILSQELIFIYIYVYVSLIIYIQSHTHSTSKICCIYVEHTKYFLIFTHYSQETSTYIIILNIKIVVTIVPYLKWETVQLHNVIVPLVSMATPSLPWASNHGLTALERLGQSVIEWSRCSFRRLKPSLPDSWLLHCQPSS